MVLIALTSQSKVIPIVKVTDFKLILEICMHPATYALLDDAPLEQW